MNYWFAYICGILTVLIPLFTVVFLWAYNSYRNEYVLKHKSGNMSVPENKGEK